VSVLVIAEPGMTWDRDLSKAFRLIDAAKACGADVCKFQWTSNGKKIQERRQVDAKYAAIYERGVQYPREWLEQLKGHCDSVGIEFACTTYLIEDIAVVAPLVKRFKVSAYESGWNDFLNAHAKYNKNVIISTNGHNGGNASEELFKVLLDMEDDSKDRLHYLYCVSKYPTKLEDLRLLNFRPECSYGELRYPYDGLSDHTANVLTGAAAVAAGASIVEAHIRSNEFTSKDNPDYGHSLSVDWTEGTRWQVKGSWFDTYVENIRTVEKML
jgi:sialic acid synthase SpsE